MRRVILIATSVSMLAAGAFAQGTPSSKATAAINTAVGCTVTTAVGSDIPAQSCHDIFTGAATPVTADNFATIMTATIKTSAAQSLFVSPSLVTGLYTDTKVKTSPGQTSTAVAEGGVYLRAVVTNQATGNTQIGYPVAACNPDILGCHADLNGNYGVTLDARLQQLSQTISACIVTVGDLTGTCTFDLTTDLILKTTSAHTFNFIFPNIGVGTYTVSIQAAVNSNATLSGSGAAVGAAAYGLGSLTVESVRLVHDFSF